MKLVINTLLTVAVFLSVIACASPKSCLDLCKSTDRKTVCKPICSK